MKDRPRVYTVFYCQSCYSTVSILSRWRRANFLYWDDIVDNIKCCGHPNWEFGKSEETLNGKILLDPRLRDPPVRRPRKKKVDRMTIVLQGIGRR